MGAVPHACDRSNVAKVMQVITADFFRRFINGEKNIPTAFDFSDSMQPPFAARYRDNVEL